MICIVKFQSWLARKLLQDFRASRGRANVPQEVGMTVNKRGYMVRSEDTAKTIRQYDV